MTGGIETDRSHLPPPGLIRVRLSAIGWTAAGAGTLVVFLAIGFLIPLFGGLHELGRLAVINGPLVAIYFVLSAVIITGRFARHVSDALAWVREDRPPDEPEHSLTLGLAAYAVKLDAVAWVLAGIVFGVLNSLLFSAGTGALILGTIWLGGETTCAVDYLLFERALRPVTACALAARPGRVCLAPGVRARLGMAWSLGTGVPLLGLLVRCSRYVAAWMTSSAASSTRGWRSTMAAKSCSSRPGSTTWPRDCASASGSATCSAVRLARMWRGWR